MTNRELVLRLIGSEPGLTDRQIRERTGIQPHQQVNQICRQLVTEGVTTRVPGPDGLIRNYPVRVGEPQRHTSPVFRVAAAPRRRQRPGARSSSGESTRLPSLSIDQTLFVIPCSGEKRGGNSGHHGRSIIEELPEPLASELVTARRRNAAKARVDRTRRWAIDRYAGTLYTSAGPGLNSLREQGAALAILSGGYGLVLPEEPIGWYDCRFAPGMWPNYLVERCLSSYVEASDIRRVVGIVSGSTTYATVLRRTRWPRSVEAFLLSPESVPGAMVKAPRAQGEALFEISMHGSLGDQWRSSDGLRMAVMRL